MKYWERTFTVTLKDDGVSQWKDRKGKNASGSHFEYFWLNVYKTTAVYTSIHILRKILKMKINILKVILCQKLDMIGNISFYNDCSIVYF